MIRISPLFIDMFNGNRRMELPDEYKINVVLRKWMPYMLFDGTSPPWGIFANRNNAPIR